MRHILIIMLSCGLLVACGVKPGSVDPPPGSENSSFPNKYPDLKTDPAPRGGGTNSH